MPITLEKLFSPTASVEFPFLGETVHVTWAPFKYTGEMQDLSDRMMAESEEEKAAIDVLREDAKALLTKAAELEAADEPDPIAIAAAREQAGEADNEVRTRQLRQDNRDKLALREVLARLIVKWDVMEGKAMLPITVESLAKLPPLFLRVVFVSLSNENQPDPLKALDSVGPSDTERTSAPSPTGTSTSPQPGRSKSRRSNSTNGLGAHATTPSGAIGG